MVLNLVIGVLPLGFVVGTSVAIGRVAGAGRLTWGGVLLAAGLAVAALLLQSVLSPFQAAFTELISRRVDGACARRLMRAALTEAPFGLLEQPALPAHIIVAMVALEPDAVRFMAGQVCVRPRGCAEDRA
jgi:ATP-binding cassette, subfamily B, bacterial